MSIDCLVDGACRVPRKQEHGPDVGSAAVAVLIYRHKKLIGQYARPLGLRTSEEAEAEAIVTALLFTWSSGLSNPIIYSDSSQVVKKLNDPHPKNLNRITPFMYTVIEIRKEFPFSLVHVQRRDVQPAHDLAHTTLNAYLKGKWCGDLKD